MYPQSLNPWFFCHAVRTCVKKEVLNGSTLDTSTINVRKNVDHFSMRIKSLTKICVVCALTVPHHRYLSPRGIASTCTKNVNNMVTSCSIICKTKVLKSLSSGLQDVLYITIE